MRSVETTPHRVSDEDDRLWSLAADRLVESQLSAFIRRHRALPTPATRTALINEIDRHVPITRKAHAALADDVECPGLLGCTCREEALAVAVATACARMSGGCVEREIKTWVDTFNTWLQGLS